MSLGNIGSFSFDLYVLVIALSLVGECCGRDHRYFYLSKVYPEQSLTIIHAWMEDMALIAVMVGGVSYVLMNQFDQGKLRRRALLLW